MAWVAANRDHVRDSRFRRAYNITLDDYNQLLRNQENCCAICGRHISELTRPLYVDHDHSTGVVRGLLCVHCNTIIGHAYDDCGILFKVISYLRRDQ